MNIEVFDLYFYGIIKIIEKCFCFWNLKLQKTFYSRKREKKIFFFNDEFFEKKIHKFDVI